MIVPFLHIQLFNNLECAIRISLLVAKMRTGNVKLVMNFQCPKKDREKKEYLLPLNDVTADFLRGEFFKMEAVLFLKGEKQETEKEERNNCMGEKNRTKTELWRLSRNQIWIYSYGICLGTWKIADIIPFDSLSWRSRGKPTNSEEGKIKSKQSVMISIRNSASSTIN